MVLELIELGKKKVGSKRGLGIKLGFNEKYAGQRINEIIKNPNITYDILSKLIIICELEETFKKIIEKENKNFDI